MLKNIISYGIIIGFSWILVGCGDSVTGTTAPADPAGTTAPAAPAAVWGWAPGSRLSLLSPWY